MRRDAIKDAWVNEKEEKEAADVPEVESPGTSGSSQ